MPLPKEKAWFFAKTYGWGWGMPQRWQGWVVIGAFFAALGAATPLLPRHPLWYVIAVNAAAAALIGICWWKGERPRWRWGDET
jgi:hypothetical protein